MEVLPETGKKFGFRRISKKHIEELRILSPSDLIAYMGLPTWKMPLITYHLRREMHKNIHKIALYPGIKEMLKKLHEGEKEIYILSSNSRKNVKKVLGSDVHPLISHYECGVSFFGKDVKLERLLRKKRINRKQAFFIGDEIRDLKAAQTAGISFGGVSWGLNNRETFQKFYPAQIFDNHEEIMKYLL